MPKPRYIFEPLPSFPLLDGYIPSGAAIPRKRWLWREHRKAAAGEHILLYMSVVVDVTRLHPIQLRHERGLFGRIA